MKNGKPQNTCWSIISIITRVLFLQHNGATSFTCNEPQSSKLATSPSRVHHVMWNVKLYFASSKPKYLIQAHHVTALDLVFKLWCNVHQNMLLLSLPCCPRRHEKRADYGCAAGNWTGKARSRLPWNEKICFSPVEQRSIQLLISTASEKECVSLSSLAQVD